MGILLRFGAVLKHHDSEAGDVLGHARSVINEGMKMRMLEVFFFFFFFFFLFIIVIIIIIVITGILLRFGAVLKHNDTEAGEFLDMRGL